MPHTRKIETIGILIALLTVLFILYYLNAVIKISTREAKIILGWAFLAGLLEIIIQNSFMDKVMKNIKKYEKIKDKKKLSRKFLQNVWLEYSNYPVWVVYYLFIISNALFPTTGWIVILLGLSFKKIIYVFIGINIVLTLDGIVQYFVNEKITLQRMRELQKYFTPNIHDKRIIRIKIRKKLLISLIIVIIIEAVYISTLAYSRAREIINSGKNIWEITSRLRIELIIITIMVIGAGVGLSMVLSDSVSKPLKEILEGMKKVGKGRLNIKLPISSLDEIAYLTQGFNKMVEGLKEKKRLEKQLFKQALLEKELTIAYNIQRQIMPERIEISNGVAAYGVSIPAKYIGGDFFDHIKVGKTKHLFFISDAAGKSVPAAFFVTIVRTIIKTMAYQHFELNRLVNIANRLLVEDSKDGMFATTFISVVDTQKRIFEFINAGHSPGILIKKGGIELLNTRGIPLGIAKNYRYKKKRIKLKKGDTIVLYTDGLTESPGKNFIEFGEERLYKILENLYNKKPSEIIEKILTELKKYTKEIDFDDITILVIQLN